MDISKTDIEQILLKNLKKKKINLKKPQIRSIVNEVYDNKKFVRDNKLTLSDLPNSQQIKSWFQDDIEFDDDTEFFEIDVYSIYKQEPIAKDIFKWAYKWHWTQFCDIPDPILELVKINKSIYRARKPENKEILKARLANICVLGTIRFYNLDRTPYLSPSQIINSTEYLSKILTFIDKANSGKYNDSIVYGDLYIFDTFNTNR